MIFTGAKTIRFMGHITLLFGLSLLPLTASAAAHYRVAIDAEYAPYEFVDIDGRVKGMLPDLLRAIGQSADVEFEFLPMAWPDAVAALKAGRVDLVNMIRTPDRIGQFEFSHPHSRIYQAMFRNEKHKNIRDLATIAGSRVALQRFDIAIERLAEREDFDRILVGSKSEGFMMLDSGKVAALFSAQQPGLYFMRQHDLKHVELAAGNLFPQDFCFTARNGNSAIIALLDGEMDVLRASGRYVDIISPWVINPAGWFELHRQQLITAFGSLLLLIIGVILWNAQLRRTVRKQTEALRREHALLADNEAYRRILYEQSPIGLALCRMDGELVDINRAYADIIGRLVDETLALSYWDITPDSYAKQEQQQLALLKKEGRYGPYDKVYVHSDGHHVPVRLNGVIVERNGEQFIWSSVENMTEQAQHEQQLKEQNRELQLYRRIFDASMDGIAIIDPQGVYIEQNRMHRQVLGFSDEELAGETPAIHFGEAAFNRVGQALAEHGSFHGELVSHSRDKRRLDIELSAFSLLDDDGQVICHVGIKRDITRRKQAEKQIKQLAGMLEATTDFVAMADVDGRMLYINAAGRQIIGLSADAAIDSLTLEALYPAVANKNIAQQILPQAICDGVCQSDCALLGREGEEVPVSAVFMTHGQTDDGRPEMFSVIARDLSNERDLQRKIEHTQRLESLGVLAGGIAHDFNNILTAILGNAAMAERKALTNPMDTRRYLANIVGSSEKAAELCKQMLAYSGKGKFVVRAINLSAMVEEITKLLEISINKGVVLKYHLAEQLPAVEADAAQMQQVIMNLVINASDAIADESGVISIATGMMQADQTYLADTSLDDQLPAGRYVYLEVSDTGCGMDAQTQAKLFEPFFTTKFTGHGLGMSAVLGIVRGHRGAIKVYSEAGKGTTFKVLLPASDVEVDLVDHNKESDQSWRGSGTVLIVDDEETIRETAAMMLEDMGFATLMATDGMDGVRVYREHQSEIVAVLMDMTMPKMDGKTCFTELRRINPDVKVILSSGYNEQEATSRFAGQGLAGFIQKPYLPDALQQTMRDVMHAS